MNNGDRLDRFLDVLRRALIMIVKWISKELGYEDKQTT